jgi:hypothetical protein
MTLRFFVPLALALVSVSVLAQSSQEPEFTDCSMEQLEPFLAAFTLAKAAYTGSSAVAAADLASAQADLAAALEKCGLGPSCPSEYAPPNTEPANGR